MRKLISRFRLEWFSSYLDLYDFMNKTILLIIGLAIGVGMQAQQYLLKISKQESEISDQLIMMVMDKSGKSRMLMLRT